MSSLGFECVNVRYGQQEALYAFTDQVKPGEWLCLIGPNGAGKSSALRAVAGLVPHRGVITVEQYYETIAGHDQAHAQDITQALGLKN